MDATETKLFRYKRASRRLLVLWSEQFAEEFPLTEFAAKGESDYPDFLDFVTRSLETLAKRRKAELDYKQSLWG